MDLPPRLPPEAGWKRLVRPIAFGLTAGLLISFAVGMLPTREGMYAILGLCLFGLVWALYEMHDTSKLMREHEAMMAEWEHRLRTEGLLREVEDLKKRYEDEL